MVVGFELGGRLIGQRGVQSLGIIDLFDEVADHLMRMIGISRERGRSLALAGPTAATERLSTTAAVAIPPNVKILAQNLRFSRNDAHPLARQQPPNNRQLELSSENTRFLGHKFSVRELSLFPVSHFRGAVQWTEPIALRGIFIFVASNLLSFIPVGRRLSMFNHRDDVPQSFGRVLSVDVHGPIIRCSRAAAPGPARSA
jgi:hypothetical protein